MDAKPPSADGDDRARESVAAYLEAVQVPAVPWRAIEERTGTLRREEARRRRRAPAWLTGAGAAVALAAVLLNQARPHATVPRRPEAFATVRQGTAAGGHGAASYGVAATAGAAAPAATATATTTARTAVLVWQGRRYLVTRVPVPAGQLGRRLAVRSPRGTGPWRAASGANAFSATALYAVRGQAAASGIAVAGRWLPGPAATWLARAIASPRRS